MALRAGKGEREATTAKNGSVPYEENVGAVGRKLLKVGQSDGRAGRATKPVSVLGSGRGPPLQVFPDSIQPFLRYRQATRSICCYR
ncbi:hypothetical protein [Bradyrhizobium sp. CCBAU 45389]|uniref:hypothetical protein n=1 Tax=Bradyrhizobium sp. CCBAU 45389 TaxID=858429 RepID=UPI00230676F8|nr:hypothetical protein [Bradyrhizobium sp. CCBAU 45389]